jgi:hypothetical protein
MASAVSTSTAVCLMRPSTGNEECGATIGEELYQTK